MSECRLYILDAPRVRSQEAALEFIESAEQRPSAKIAAFLAELLRIHPDRAEDADSIWYESVGSDAPKGPVLQLFFKLARFDHAALQSVCATAAAHKLLVFDEEGYVLYLVDGTELAPGKTAEAARTSSAHGATRSPEGLRFDGVYVAAMGGNTSYYRFTADGHVFRQSVVGRPDPPRAFRQMVKGDPFVAHGPYYIEQGHAEGQVRAPNGTFYLRAKIAPDALSLTSWGKGGSHRYSAVYHFVELPQLAS